ncbi:type I phosphomannose isomerase catalytic subunit [Faecalispora anaeroviscerum]|uniref:type I phosphomannose isomerase catalytic subunit n=1 Tax=Faecalispora anaeroviscerum TaxID=2991836 RepID=UPI0024BBAE7E|nr:type I phosphomannose isomerase catalytic subunit [Faecalispora anaeroviscerum]
MKSSDHLPSFAKAPFALDNPRVWRTCLGGKLLDALHGRTVQEDSHFPEEWIASTVTARNAGREQIADEGLSHPEAAPQVSLRELIGSDPAAYLGAKSAQRDGQMGVLIKLIDSSERLSIQVHPSRQQAKALFQSEYGKTECWHILGGRETDGEKPAIYLGFRPGITREYWSELFERQNIPGMLECMHRFEVSRGNTFLIEGGTPHAIGAGCFLAEIQEPTDYTIRVERSTPSGLHIADSMCHQGLGFEKMFDCFSYTGYSDEDTLKKWKIPGRVEIEDTTLRTQLIGYSNTPMFRMDSLWIPSRAHLQQIGEFSVFCVLAGSGRLVCGTSELPLSPGRQVFFPAQSGDCDVLTDGGEPLEILQCFGPL